MTLEPDGINNIVVLIKVNNSLNYYVTDKETWILNNEILNNAFKEKGYAISEYEDDIRYGFTILSEKNIVRFTDNVGNFKVEKKELEEFYNIYNEVYDDVEYVALPIFYINFDKRTFYSFFTEPGSYEKYMPGGWKGYLCLGEENKYIPSDAKYW